MAIRAISGGRVGFPGQVTRSRGSGASDNAATAVVSAPRSRTLGDNLEADSFQTRNVGELALEDVTYGDPRRGKSSRGPTDPDGNGRNRAPVRSNAGLRGYGSSRR